VTIDVARPGPGPVHQEDPLGSLADWLCSELPLQAEIVTAAGDLLFDFCACVVAGQSGFSAGWPERQASCLAVAAHRGDRDDVHYATLSHPGGIVWPVVIALGRQSNSDGENALRAAVTGYEVIVRLARALGPAHRSLWHVTSTAGTVAAAATAGVLFGLDRAGLRAAMSHAASVAGGSRQALAERSPTRLLQRAHAVDSGIACARAAAAGVDASRYPLVGVAGLFAGTAPSAYADALVQAGRTAAVQETSVRLRATSGFGQAAVNAASALGPVTPDAVDAVRITVAQLAATVAGDLQPDGPEAAWWSIPYAVAVTLIHGSPEALEAGWRSDPETHEMLDKCRLDVGPSVTEASVELELSGGKRSRASASCIGEPTDAERIAKWSRATKRPGADALACARDLPGSNLSVTLDTLLRPPPGADEGDPRA
jgi:2-methylcitrate dehydratase PrpD